MPEYLSILREFSVFSIYALFVFVLLLLIIKGRIKEKNLSIIFYVWLPIAVITQFFMTYYRAHLGKSNLPIMNIYLVVEFVILTVVMLRINSKVFGKLVNYKIWAFVILGGVLVHLLDPINTIHNSAMLYIAIVYFQISVNFVELNKVEEFLQNPYSFLNIAIFVKAFGYSYFLIYQTDYKFPLSIYSAVNLLVQILFALSLVLYYKSQKQISNRDSIPE